MDTLLDICYIPPIIDQSLLIIAFANPSSSTATTTLTSLPMAVLTPLDWQYYEVEFDVSLLIEYISFSLLAAQSPKREVPISGPFSL